MLKQFKEFAFKGNLIDMAVGIIIGGAFATVVKSLVDNVFMPVLGKVTGGINFADQYINLEGDNTIPFAEAKEKGWPVIGYGQFIQDFLSFIILALVVFIVIKKVIGSMQKEKEEAPAAPPAQEVLLTEIRDLLKKD
ncbi:large conductance mechanosensitive channel protein MscL [bacterium]|nr:large conductance mechanosensitive channel protein MscL [bacterium]